MDIFVYIAMAGVVVILIAGLYSLWRGGDFSRSYSNRLMRLRIVFQAVAVILLFIAVARPWEWFQ